MIRPLLIVKLFQNTAKIQRKRMFMTVMAITWGTISIILLLSFGEGMKRSMNVGKRGTGEGIMVVWASETGRAYAGFNAGRKIWIRPDDMKLLEANIPEIESIAGEMIRWGVQLSCGRTAVNKKVVGAEPAYGNMRCHYPEAGGRFLNRMDEEKKRRVVFLGNKVKEEMFGAGPAVGNTVLLNGATFTVIGVMREKRQMGMYSGPDENHVVIPLSTFQVIFGDPYIDDVVIKPRYPEQSEFVQRRVYEVLAGKYRFDPDDLRALHIWDIAAAAREMNNVMTGIQIFLGVIGGLTLLIGGIGVANIMYATVKQRVKQIGVQMAVGCRKVYVMGPIVLESVTLTAVGGLLGLFFGYLLVQALAFLSRQSDNEAMQFMGEPTVSIPIAVVTILILGTIGLLAGYFPSRRAASIQPAEALRHE